MAADKPCPLLQPSLVRLTLPGQKELELGQMKHILVAGDRRANEHPFLSSVHAIFLREHNRIAKLLKEYLPPHLRQVKI